MIYAVIAFVCLAASSVGAAVGIGGGVIIKPVIDSLNIMDVSTVSFLSGVTVLCMSTYSVIKGKISGQTKINVPMAAAISVGAVIGGIAGKIIFSRIMQAFDGGSTVGAVQAVCLFVLTAITLVYSLRKEYIVKLRVRNFGASAAAGFALGMFSSFLGIGGGPINIMFLSFLFSFGVKSSASYSLFIIMCSQMSSLIWQAVSGDIPEFSAAVLIIMAVCGIIGGALGMKIKKGLKESSISKLFNAVLVTIMCICIYNFINCIKL